MSQRIQIVLPDPAAELLRERAATDGTPPSTLAGQYVREQLKSTTPPAAVVTDRPRPTRRPGWLEPFGGSNSWRAETWGSIVALHARYPRTLANVKDRWWSEQEHLETLCALAVWRAQLDSNGQDPREELSFHAQLAEYAHSLRSQGGGVTKNWEPGAPPSDWT